MNQAEIGFASSINHYIVWVKGLPNVSINEIVQTRQSAKGLVTSFKEDLVEVLMLDEAAIRPQEQFGRTFSQLAISAGSHLLGRVINPLGQPIDGKGGFTKLGKVCPLNERPAPIKERSEITRQFATGTTLVDMLVPLAFGQRELVIGDAHSGKTGFLLDTVINQAGKKTSPAGGQVICVYTMIGKPNSEIRNLVEVLKVNKALDYTAVVAASASEKAPLGFLAPSTGITIAEYFRKQGQDVLLILDDLGIHAKFYREISLLSGKAPGRQSYPGDIFFAHARILERAGNFAKAAGGGSITALPVIEASSDDFASYMSTNLMGMTDGHLKFDAARYHQGIRPSIDVALSVSRVGRQTQALAQKELADKVKAILAEGTKLETYSRLGSDISVQTQQIIKQSRQIGVILNQPRSTNIPTVVQILLVGLTFTPFLTQQDVNFVSRNKAAIVDYLTKKIDLNKLAKSVGQMKSATELISSLGPLSQELTKICK